MDIRSNVDNLKTLLGVPSTSPPSTQPVRKETSLKATGLDGDRATVSGAGAEVAQSTAGPDVRAEKVAAVQAALSVGTYHVPASAVAARIVNTMLGGETASGV